MIETKLTHLKLNKNSVIILSGEFDEASLAMFREMLNDMNLGFKVPVMFIPEADVVDNVTIQQKEEARSQDGE